jgi:hypothetical protein
MDVAFAEKLLLEAKEIMNPVVIFCNPYDSARISGFGEYM